MICVLATPMVGGPCTGPSAALGAGALVPVMVWYTTTPVSAISTGSA